MPAGGQVTRKPTERGAPILAFILKHFDSLAAAARTAGLSDKTLSRVIFEDRGKRMAPLTRMGLQRINVPRHMLW